MKDQRKDQKENHKNEFPARICRSINFSSKHIKSRTYQQKEEEQEEEEENRDKLYLLSPESNLEI